MKCASRDQAWTIRQDAHKVVVPVNGSLRSNNIEVLRDAVLTGLGVGLLPDWLVQDVTYRGNAGDVARVVGRGAQRVQFGLYRALSSESSRIAPCGDFP
ncbi:LysR substrate-binding domain-containing protein [Cupriavidus pauculus]|uniref:LysR substrate-binding domain-containing protein n=1 Tax=Cupriavidus pauculus TaxID=82633 RepID=UPI003857C79E